MTKNEAKEAALRWIDEATVNGSEPVSGELEDYRDRMDYLLDGVLNGLAAIFPLSGVCAMTHCPMKNLLNGGQEIRRVMPSEAFTLANDQAKSFYMEISGSAEVTFPDGRTEQVNSSGFTAVRGNLTEGSGVVVAGEYPFLVRNAALYGSSFAEDDQVPAFAATVQYELPEDFRMLRRVVRQWNGCEEECTDYRCEDGRHLLLPYEKWGEYRVYYDRRPTKVSHEATDDMELDCDPVAENLIPLKLAADVTMGTLDRAQTGYYLESRYTSMLLTVQTNRPGEQVRIQSVFSPM